MGIGEVLGPKRAAVLELAERRGVYNVRVFGSVARGEAGPDSDIDFLVDVHPGVGMAFSACGRSWRSCWGARWTS